MIIGEAAGHLSHCDTRATDCGVYLGSDLTSVLHSVTTVEDGLDFLVANPRAQRGVELRAGQTLDPRPERSVDPASF